MVDSESNPNGSYRAGKISASVAAIFVVVIMVTTSFVAMLASGTDDPEIWTDRDEYAPGETVYIFGDGFFRWIDVEIELYHPDIGTLSYVETPDLYGRFLCDDYVAEWVTNTDVPVNVTATQHLEDGDLVATTQFWDPAACIEGYTLRPHLRWTQGDIKGYDEGDSVPMSVCLNRQQLQNTPNVTIIIGVDFIDLNSPTNPAYAIDYLTGGYYDETPSAPHNILPNSSMPFYVHPDEGNITNQERLPNHVSDEGPFQILQVWRFDMDFAPGATNAFVYFGAHLALTDFSQDPDYLGASFYPGSAAHVRMVKIWPSSDEGNRDVPIMLGDVMMPPKMNLEKECCPTTVVEGDEITFTLHWNNTGQADADCVNITDTLPCAADLDPSSFLFWTGTSSPSAPSPGPVVDGNSFYWYIGEWPGTGLDSGDSVVDGYLSFRATVNTNEPGCHNNTAYLYYSDDHGGWYPPEMAWCHFCIVSEPEITIDKSGPMYAHVGDTITYTYTVTNTGDVDLVDVDVVDDVAGVVASDQSLDAGDTATYTKTYTVLGTEGDPLVNEATATGEDEYGRMTDDDDTWSVDILHPAIEVYKWSELECAEEGETVTYWISVYNPSCDTTLYNVTVDDPMLGSWQIGTLNPGQTFYLDPIDHTIPQGADDPYINEVTAAGEDLIHMMVCDSASWTMDIHHPMIMVEKGADKVCAEIGEMVVYWINVSNPSWDTEMTAEVSDPMLGLSITIVLGPGEYWNESFEFVVESDESDPLVNTVTVVAWDCQEHFVRATAEWWIDIYHPMIQVTKEADKSCAMIGEEVIYWINVTNPSPDTPMHVVVEDSMFGPLFDDWLEPWEEWNWTKVYTVTPEDPDPLVNCVWANATDPQDHPASDYDEWIVDIYHPAIEITKEADKVCAEVGEEVTYWINVTNPSRDTPMHVIVEDSMFGLLFDGCLAAGESWRLAIVYTVSPNDPDPLINRVWANATDPQQHPASDYDEWTVDIYHPAIEITKEANKVCAAVDELVIYWINVTNPSDDTPMHAVVTDPMFGGVVFDAWLDPGQTESIMLTYVILPDDGDPLVNTVTVVANDPQDHVRRASASWTIDVVHPDVIVTKEADKVCAEVGEEVTYWINVTNPQDADVWLNGTVWDDTLGQSWSFTDLMPGCTVPFTVIVQMPDIDPFVNEVRVVAYDHQMHEVCDSASWTVDVVHPAIEISKIADKPCAAVGEEVTYTIVVWVPADADVWMNGTVHDEMLDVLEHFTLMPGESYTVTRTIMVPPDVDPLVNVAWVEAWDHQEHLREARASWTIDVVHPEVMIFKEADKRCAEVGEEVNYTITVVNPEWADVWLNGTVYDDVLGMTWSFTDLAPGASVNFTATARMPDVDPFVNLAWVIAKDHQGHEVGDEACWTVDVVHPMIEVTKTAQMACAHDGETLWYTITVSVPAEADVWMNGTVYDDDLQWIESFFDLMPGGSISWTIEYIVDDDVTPDPFVNVVRVEAYDHQRHLRTDTDSFTVDILHPDIEVTKEGPESENVGETITYYVNVTNTGDTPLYNVTVDDSLKGVIALIAMIDVDETVYLTYTYVVPSGEGMLDNVVTVDGEDKQHMWVRDSDSWSVFKYGIVTGFKFADLNMNRFMDLDEPGLMLWTIVLNGTTISGDVVYMTRLTDTFGHYEFLGLSAGVYTVSEVMVSGWMNVTLMSTTVVVGSGSAFQCDFGNVPLGSISGYKWLDVDIDGIWDLDEDGIEEWTIYLSGYDIEGIPVFMQTLTDGTGYYVFDDLLPGVYTVYEEVPEGWFPTTPTSVDVEVSALEPFEVTDVNFGNSQYGSICGYKWLDEYMNGYKDGYEVFLPGWVIELTGVLANGEPFGPIYTETGVTGWYCFEGLMPGTYIVRELIPEGWYNVTPSWREITLDVGDHVTCAKFGNVEYGFIDGWKFLDWDMDGMKDGIEPGIPGWEITLTGYLNDGPIPWSTTGTPVGPITVLTDADGYWCFPNLLPGIYTVSEALYPDWAPTTPPSVTIWVTSGMVLIDVKFGNVPYTCLWGYKFEDINGNGEWDEREPGLPGWTIVVEGVQNDGVPVHLEMITDEFGRWATCFNILPGEYLIYEIWQEGWDPTTPDSYMFYIPMSMCPMAYEFWFGNFELGKIFGWKYEDMNGNGILDDGDVPIEGWEIYLSGPMSGMTTTNETGYYEFDGLVYGMYEVTEECRPNWVATSPTSYTALVTSGACIELEAFLNVEWSIIWGYKFEDINSNGVWDDGEPGIEGWTIYMLWDAMTVPVTTVTNETGYYEFSGLMPDEWYMIWEEEREGWTNTTETWEVVSIVSGSDIRIHDFGNFENVDILIFKYEDVNGNGVYDEGDVPLGRWMMTVSGPGIDGGSVVVYTDEYGFASVEVTAAGSYLVVEDLPEGWCNTTPAERGVSVISGSADPELVMFGNFHCVEITLFKYDDVNSNGVYDNDDAPIQGWMFTLISMGGAYMEVVTGPDGTVNVTICRADLWTVYEERREGWCWITPEEGYYSFYTLSGVAIELSSQEPMFWYEFGNFHCVKVTIFKYLDTCSNGWYDPGAGDEPIEGWYFEVYAPDGSLYLSGYTDENGYLNFTVCSAGNYTVVEEDREGWSHITPLSGYYVIEVKSGDRQITLWFGNYLDVDIPIFKYEDRNSNDEYDNDDVPIPRWYFELVHMDGTTYTGYTDENGMLVLTVNRSGIYTLYEEDRIGWTHINPETGMRVIDVTSGQDVPLQEFGNFRDVTIWVFKYNDLLGDGRYDPGMDEPLEGWDFIVTGPWVGSGTIITTGPDGMASIVVDRAGEYHLEEMVQMGWTPTTPTMQSVMVESSDEPEPLMFGNFRWVEIVVFKYEDVNSNGVYDDGDVPLGGWTIEAYSEMTGQYITVVTGPDGYAYMTLMNGGEWWLYEDVEFGWEPINPPSGEYQLWVTSGAAFDVFMFGNFHCVTIEVFKYEDKNSNGVYDNDDVPIEGWYFELFTSTGMLSDYGWTGADGYLHFHVCVHDEWTVVEEMLCGWTPINPANGRLTVSTPSGAMPDTLMFGNFLDVVIWVFKFEDKNSNGVYDNDDVPLPDWEFTIFGPGVTNPVALTDGSGNAYFTVNRSGMYTVIEEERPGWTHTTAPMMDVFVESGMMMLEPLMFGNFWNVIIIVYKFDDILADEQYCPMDGDVMIEGWMFELLLWDGDEWVLVAVNYTDASGMATFTVTQAGLYLVREEEGEGWKCILPPTGEYEVEIISGLGVIELWFANFKLGKIFGWKWNDLNGNGEWDEGEPALEGWTIWFECLGPYYLTGWTVTNAEGYYEFTGLPGGTYLVWEIVQPGWMAISPEEVEVDIIGHTEERVDFFNFERGCVWGYKYEDMNGNGVFDDGDVPIEGWTIYLSITTGVIETPEGPISAIMLLAIATTDGDGYYSFCGLGPGIYVVDEEQRPGWVATNESSETVVMTSGACIRIHDFMNVEWSIIWGYKFVDVNSNGVWDDGEPGKEGWTIYMLWDAMTVPVTTVTNETGYYEFSGLMPDEWYMIWEEEREGWTNTTETWEVVSIVSGSDIRIHDFGNFENVDILIFKYEDVNGNGVYDNGDLPLGDWMFWVEGPCFDQPVYLYTDGTGHASIVVTAAGRYNVTEEDKAGWMHVSPDDGNLSVTVQSGTSLNPLMFGNFVPGQITGQKFYDWNLNGELDGEEYGLANWIIWVNGSLVGGGWLNFTRQTDSNGLFSVAGLPAGTYTVSERLEFAPPGWVPTTGTMTLVTIESGTFASASFGNVIFGVIEGYKFYDKDLDGFMDENEPGLAGWTIILEGYDDSGAYVYRTTLTNATGKYIFGEVQPGVYNVTEVCPGDWQPTTPLPVVVSVSGAMVYFDIWVNIGNVRYGMVHGYKFLDTYMDVYPYWPNGVFDEYECGLGNWEITLEGWTETGVYVQRVQYTDNIDNIGYYRFDMLLPGTYWVNETLQYGFYATRPISNLVMIYPFPMGPVVLTIDFGNILPTPDPEINFVLEEGFNLWSSPLRIEGGLMASGLADAIGTGKVVKISRFDAATQTYSTFIPGVNSPGSAHDFEIVLGVGYWVVASERTAFTLVGDLVVGQEVDLAGGWNILGYTDMVSTKASDLVNAISGAKVYKISYYDAASGRYGTFIPGVNSPGSAHDFTVTQGRAYWIVTDGPAVVDYGALL